MPIVDLGRPRTKENFGRTIHNPTKNNFDKNNPSLSKIDLSAFSDWTLPYVEAIWLRSRLYKLRPKPSLVD